MFNIFKKSKVQNSTNLRHNEFEFLDGYYFDTACQSLRPESVIKAQNDYFYNFNSCGHRVKYDWGKKLDKIISETRKSVLKLTKKNEKDYVVFFSLNTTYAMNLIINQLNLSTFKQVVTSEIEHNSVFLPSIVIAKKFNIPRIVLQRDDQGNLIYNINDLKDSIVILNTTSNIDGRELLNLSEISQIAKNNNSILLLDSCQTFNHNPDLLHDIEFDASFGGGHKMYAPSLGFGIVKKTLLEKMDFNWIGGSTVEDVSLDTYTLISDPEELYAKLEPGLANFSGIVGLQRAIEFRTNFKHINLNAKNYEHSLSVILSQEIKKIPKINFSREFDTSPIISFYLEGIDSFLLGDLLATKGIMCRTGYHCCHYFLKKVQHYPPLCRVSLGLHNTENDVNFFLEQLAQISKNF